MSVKKNRGAVITIHFHPLIWFWVTGSHYLYSEKVDNDVLDIFLIPSIEGGLVMLEVIFKDDNESFHRKKER